MESLRQYEYETINVSNNSKGLLFIIEKECLNSLDVIPRYSIASTSITDDPRLTHDLTEITNQDIVALLNKKTDYEIVKVNTLFYCINNNTDTLGWQYTHRPAKHPEEKDEETSVEEEWSRECSDKNFRRRLWILQLSLPLERDEIQTPHYELNENFETVLLFSKESIDVKVIEHENSLSDYESDCSLHIYYRFIKIYSEQNQMEHKFTISNHTRVSIFHDSLRPYSIQIADRDFNLIIAMTSVIDNRKIFSILSHIVDIHKSNENMVSSTYMKYHNPTSGAVCTFPLLYSDILVITDTGPKSYSLRLFSHRIELYFKGRKVQTHSLREGRIHDTGKLEFGLEFEHCNNQIITILFRCLNFKSKRVWEDTISQTITMINRIERESFAKEFQRTMDLWGAIDEVFQHHVHDIINIRQSKCRVEAENDLLELIRIQRQDTTTSSDLGHGHLRRISTSKCCIIL